MAISARSIFDIGGYRTLCFTGCRVPVGLSSEMNEKAIHLGESKGKGKSEGGNNKRCGIWLLRVYLEFS